MVHATSTSEVFEQLCASVPRMPLWASASAVFQPDGEGHAVCPRTGGPLIALTDSETSPWPHRHLTLLAKSDMASFVDSPGGSAVV